MIVLCPAPTNSTRSSRNEEERQRLAARAQIVDPRWRLLLPHSASSQSDFPRNEGHIPYQLGNDVPYALVHSG
jgi:hypothetical protein